MADSTTPIPQLLPSESSPETRLNELFDAASAAMVYGRNAATCTGRVFGYLGGRWGGFSVANGVSASLTASTTQYMVVERATGAVTFASTTTNWDDATLYARAYKLTVGTTTITAYEDHRAGNLGTLGAGSSGGGASTNWKQAVRAGTTTAGTLATSFENGDTIDGVTLATGDRILIKNQASASENGIYVVAASGAPTRATDADSGSELVNATVFVSEGTTLADTQWTCTANAPITVGSTSLAFAQIGAGGGSTQGKHAIYIAASSMRPTAANGCEAVVVAAQVGFPDVVYMNFDATTQEYAQFAFAPPKKWDEGTITFKVYWSHAATTTNFGVVWSLQAVAVSDDDTMSVAYGTEQTSTDTGGTTNDLYVSPESSAITVAGTPASEDMVFFRLSRVTGNGSDTMAIDARMMGVTVYLNTNADTDA